MSTESQKSEIVKELQNLAQDLKELLGDEALLGNAKAKALRDKLEGKFDDIRVSAKELGKEATVRAKHAVQAADDYAHEEPWRLIGAGAAVGLIVGILLGRR